MKKLATKKDVYKFIGYCLTILLLIVSSFLPFVKVGESQVFLVHFFNSTSHPYNGNIENFYGIILPIITLVSLILDMFDLKHNDYKKEVFNTCLKITLLASYIFTLTNYFRVIYPDGFLVSGDVSILESGFYLFVIFLIFLLGIIIHKTDKLYHIRRDNIGKLVINYDKTIKKYYKIIQIFSVISMFCVFSLLFVPFARNYQSTMNEPGFEGILDKRTSIDYYIFAMFDKDFNLNILGIAVIYLAAFIPTTLLLIPKKTTFIQILVASIFDIIFMILALIFASQNYFLITPKLFLFIDPFCLFFIILNIISLIILAVFSSLLINYRRKELKDVAKNVNNL